MAAGGVAGREGRCVGAPVLGALMGPRGGPKCTLLRILVGWCRKTSMQTSVMEGHFWGCVGVVQTAKQHVNLVTLL